MYQTDYVGQPPPSGLHNRDRDAGSASGPISVAAGKIVSIPTAPGSYTMWLLVEDKPGGSLLQPRFGFDDNGDYNLDEEWRDQLVVAQWHFEVAATVDKFVVNDFSRESNNLSSEYIVDKEIGRLDCALGEKYRIAPINLNTLNISNANDGGSGDKKIQFLLSGAPKGFFSDASNGEVLAIPTQATPLDGNGDPIPVVAQLFAVDASGAQAPIQTINITVRPKDTASASHGPNRRGCNTGEMIDGLEFDKNFTCDCADTAFVGDNCDQAGPNNKTCDNGGAIVDTTPLDFLYSCDCNSTSGYTGENCQERVVQTTAPSKTVDLEVAATTGGCLIFILLVVAAVYKRRLQAASMRAHDFEATLAEMQDRGEIAAEQVNALDTAARSGPREIKRSHVVMLSKIGKGAFGEVWRAILDESAVGGVPGFLVAIKTCTVGGGDGEVDMVKEATVMSLVPNHPNIVPLIGVVTSGTPLYLIVPLCEHGSMLSFVKKRFAGVLQQRLPISEKISMAADIAKGMAHLSSHSFVHRDLAARNVLVDSMYRCRVADFGLSRATAGTTKQGEDGEDREEHYYRSERGQFPVRWTAPEAMETLKFTTQTDVWSFGITVAEVFNDGKRPYAGLDNLVVLTSVMAGQHDKRPETCPDNVWETVLLPCWQHDPRNRPSFEELAAALELCATNCNAPAAVQAGPAPVMTPSSEAAGVGTTHYLPSLNMIPASTDDATGIDASAEEEESIYSEALYKHVYTSVSETETVVSPLEGLANTKAVSLRSALASASQHSLCNTPDMMLALEASITFAQNLVRRGKAVGLNVDQVAAIHLYSQDLPEKCPFYSILNGVLGGWGRDGREPAPHYLPYVRLAIDAIALLPKEENLVVYRGVDQSVPLLILLQGKGVGDILTWWAFTSTTSEPDVLRDPVFLGVGAEWGERTVFKITIQTGVRIKRFSNFGTDFDDYLQPVGATGQNEEEILLSPGTSFVIDSIETYTNNITEVTMHEVVHTPTPPPPPSTDSVELVNVAETQFSLTIPTTAVEDTSAGTLETNEQTSTLASSYGAPVLAAGINDGDDEFVQAIQDLRNDQGENAVSEFEC